MEKTQFKVALAAMAITILILSIGYYAGISNPNYLTGSIHSMSPEMQQMTPEAKMGLWNQSKEDFNFCFQTCTQRFGMNAQQCQENCATIPSMPTPDFHAEERAMERQPNPTPIEMPHLIPEEGSFHSAAPHNLQEAISEVLQNELSRLGNELKHLALQAGNGDDPEVNAIRNEILNRAGQDILESIENALELFFISGDEANDIGDLGAKDEIIIEVDEVAPPQQRTADSELKKTTEKPSIPSPTKPGFISGDEGNDIKDLGAKGGDTPLGISGDEGNDIRDLSTQPDTGILRISGDEANDLKDL